MPLQGKCIPKIQRSLFSMEQLGFAASEFISMHTHSYIKFKFK